jgi:CRISPR-associated protein Cas1
MRALVVREQGAVIKVAGDRVVAAKGGRVLARARARDLRHLSLLGHIHLTTPALRVLLARGVEVGIYSQAGRLLGRLSPPASGGDVEARVAQHRALAQTAKRLDFARACVDGKLVNQRRFLVRPQARRRRAELRRALEELRYLRDKAAKATDLDALRGVEGAGAVAYFSAWPTLLEGTGFSWVGRKRRPPPDPVNALLSLGYTVLTPRVAAAVERVGLDPDVGALHALERGRPSFVLDLVEEWRPLIVDTAVVRLLREGGVRIDDFPPARDDRGVEMPPYVVARLFAALDRRFLERARDPRTGDRRDYAAIIEGQVRAAAHSFLSGDTYVPMEQPR